MTVNQDSKNFLLPINCAIDLEITIKFVENSDIPSAHTGGI